MGTPRGHTDWVPLFVRATASPGLDSPLATSTELPLSPRQLDRAGFPFHSPSRTSPFASPASPSVSSAFSQYRLGTPGLDGGRGLLHRSPGLGIRAGATGEGSRSQHVRRRSSVAGQEVAGSEMERVLSLTSLMAGRRSSLSKQRGTDYSKRKLLWTFFARSALLLFITFLLLLAARRFVPARLSHLPTFATVPYLTSSHPRTPARTDHSSLADFLTTRLGSHFSLPSLDAPSHLWLTTATSTSIRLSARHLRAFVQELDGVQARRELVVLCLDDGCMEYCRTADWLCFGGFIGTERDAALVEEVKLRGSVEAMQSGRLVFLVDDGMYFRRDPLPDLGDLQRYDIQLPRDWSSADPNAGFVFLSPTAGTISLLTRMLSIHISGTQPLWSSTNLLLDPEGLARGYKQITPVSLSVEVAAVRDDGLFELERVEVGYGQSEFESAWGGGMDVRVLDPKKFKTTVGVPKEGEGSEALYLSCVCCGIPAATDYIAGSLGFHAPSLLYPTTTSTGLPILPQILTLPSLPSPALLPLLLQLANDSNRSFLPPLSLPRIRPLSNTGPPILPATYLTISLAHLTTFPSSPALASTLSELKETLWLDLASPTSYATLLTALKQPFFLDTKVVSLENVDALIGRGWEAREEFGVELGEEELGKECREMLRRPGREEERWAEGARDRAEARKMEEGRTGR